MIKVANVFHELIKLFVTQTRFPAMFFPLSFQKERKRKIGVLERGVKEEWTERKTGRQKDRQTGRHVGRQAGRQIGMLAGR